MRWNRMRNTSKIFKNNRFFLRSDFSAYWQNGIDKYMANEIAKIDYGRLGLVSSATSITSVRLDGDVIYSFKHTNLIKAFDEQQFELMYYICEAHLAMFMK